MDKSINYILMCKEAQEIQGMWCHSRCMSGDWYFHIALDGVYVVSDIEQRNENCIWLPRQDQLQKLIEGNFTEKLDKLIKMGVKGIFNIGVKEKVSYYEFGLNLCNAFGFNKKLIRQATSLEFQYNYPKDTYLSLDCLKNLGLNTLSIKEDMELLKNENR